jgi:hypothetical protein
MGPQLNMMIRQILPEGFDHIAGTIGKRKDSAAALDLGFHAISAQKGQKIITEEGTKGSVKEATVIAIHADKIFPWLMIRQVAARLPADQDFLPRLIRLLQQNNFRASFCRPTSRHHAARSGTDDQNPVEVSS